MGQYGKSHLVAFAYREHSWYCLSGSGADCVSVFCLRDLDLLCFLVCVNTNEKTHLTSGL